MNSPLSIKLVFGDDIRKIFVENLSMHSLCDRIKLLYPDLENAVLDDLYLYYIDEDDDKIRIKFDMELSEALRQTKESRMLKIFIINLASPSSSNTSIDTASTIIPFINLLTSLSSLPPQSPASDALNASLLGMLGCALPFNGIATSLPYNDTLSTSDFTHIDKSTCDSSVYASPNYNSVSTNTLIDAKDVGTETPLNSVTQTTQTCQPDSDTHQTTQTQYNLSCATQTAQSLPACAAETQTAQTAQVLPAFAVETQTGHEDASPAVSFFDSLAGTQFGSLLEKLQELGFSDKQKCVQALAKYSGKLHEAIDELLLDELLA